MKTECVIIKCLLTPVGIGCVSAIFPALMPLSWIQETHEWLGLGEFPEAPIAEYLARGMSVMCVFYGGVALVIARDVMRYLPVIRFQAIFICILAPVGLFLSLRTGLPAKYLVMDAAGAVLMMLPVLILSFKLKPEE